MDAGKLRGHLAKYGIAWSATHPPHGDVRQEPARLIDGEPLPNLTGEVVQPGFRIHTDPQRCTEVACASERQRTRLR